jgi:putative nucleotidyltransferase with HDIG domain
MVGMRGIRNLLYSLGSLQSLGTTTSNASELWRHANQIAFNTYNLSRNFFADDKQIIEDSYVCGLLHDMGKIILESANEQMFNKMLDICEARGIPSPLIETLMSGANHAEVGARIAEKWNFPDVLVNILRYHHEPEMAADEFRKLAWLVYFADMMCHYQDGEVEYYQFAPEALALFKITSEAQLRALSDRLEEAFKSDSAASGG